MMEEVSIAAATAVVGYDLLQDSQVRQAGRTRRIVAAGLKGSAAAGDTLVELKAGNVSVGRIYNTGTGFPNRDDMKRVGALVPANEELHAYIVDAPATNPINLLLDVE